MLMISKENIGKFYKFEKFLGSGGFGAGYLIKFNFYSNISTISSIEIKS